MLNLGPNFNKESEQLDDLLNTRDNVNSRTVPLGIPFVDDCIGGVRPRDLLLVAADTGVGKTDLGVTACIAGVQAGQRVHGFFLEAETGEVAARVYYQELCRREQNINVDFGGWWRGQLKHLDAKHGDDIKATIAPLLSGMNVLYKKEGNFTNRNLSQCLKEIKGQTDMVILDHLHELDTGDQDDRKAEQETITLLRDMAMAGIPVVVLAQIRKTQSGQSRLLPTKDDILGSKAIISKATQVLLIAPDRRTEQPSPHLHPTLMQMDKDRKGRAGRAVARVFYDKSTGRYRDVYDLGYVEWEKRQQVWTRMSAESLPYWADNEARKKGEAPF